MNDETVPFGKYRGQPVEVLQNDKQYCDWLSGQDWFRDKYQNIFNVIINNFAEPSETPEHNAIQVMFLDEMFCITVCKMVLGGEFIDLSEFSKRAEILGSIRNKANKEAVKFFEGCEFGINYEIAQGNFLKKEYEILNSYPDYESIRKSCDFNCVKEIKFEEKGIDVLIITRERNIAIEIKPKVGDDYPAILRQIKSRDKLGWSVLLIDKYTGTGATKEQMVKTFEMSGIIVVWLDDVKSSVTSIGAK